MLWWLFSREAVEIIEKIAVECPSLSPVILIRTEMDDVDMTCQRLAASFPSFLFFGFVFSVRSDSAAIQKQKQISCFVFVFALP
jgi:hypothetical protein